MKYLYFAAVPILALCIDGILGDPRSQYHPVVLMGRVISLGEKILYRPTATNQEKIRDGILMVLFTLTIIALVGALILAIFSAFGFYGYVLGSALVLYTTIAPKALARDANEIVHVLAEGDLNKARQCLSWIVGRDTNHLNESEIARATIETISENIVDGIISPFFYFLLLGPIGALLYRASNTMDSMLGYKNERYLYFGRAAAKWDDILNYIPARLTAGLLLLSGWILHDDVSQGYAMMKRDAQKHPSPNGGYAEATVAGLLGIRLGGYNYYQGVAEFRAYMGDMHKSITRVHIQKTVQLMYMCAVLMAFLGSALMMIR